MIHDELELNQELSRPSEALISSIRTLASPLVILGAGGKMGPTIAVMARRAAEMAGHKLEVVAGSRFSDWQTRDWLEEQGVRTLGIDLLERDSVRKLPDTGNVLYLAGMKFGTAKNPALTWAINTLAPAHVCERYPSARIVALSTGNVYPLVPVSTGGAKESHPLTPLGEYANAAVARERVFGYFGSKHPQPIVILRLNYAVELRYGVLVDIAQKVWRGDEIDLGNGYFNCIWQRDANELILRAFNLATPGAQAWNLTGLQTLKVREVAEQFAAMLGKEVRLRGREADTALLSDASWLSEALGKPPTEVSFMMREIANWIHSNGRLLNKPTKFEVRDGAF